MKIIEYLFEIYGYDNPIFVKDIRIGGRSKSAIREELYRACKKGIIERESNGIYFFRSNKQFGSGVGFEQILDKKFIYSDFVPDELKERHIEGYFSGLTFVNQIGISTQVPAIYEITTNKTRSKKKIFKCRGFMAIIRKGRTEINSENYKFLQFLDMFHFVALYEVQDCKELICEYAKKIGFNKAAYDKYIKYYGPQTIKMIVEGGILEGISR